MAQIDPQQLLAAAMSSGTNAGSATGAPTDAMGGGASTDTLPSAGASAAPTGASPQGADTSVAGSAGVANTNLANLVGSGSELSQDPQAIQQMVAQLQDPSTPPDQKQQIQMRLQLAALASLAQNPVGSPSAQAQGS